MLFWTALAFALLAVVILAAVFARHWKELRLLDPETIRAERERRTRDQIVTQRLERRLANWLAPAERAARSFADFLTRAYRQIEERLARFSASVSAPVYPGASSGSASDAVQRLLTDAQALAREERWAEAERVFLEILKRDDRQLDAYRGLAAIYLAQKQYVQAKETFQFLERIHGADDSCYAGLAEIAEAEGKLTQAEAQRKRAVDKNPKNALRHAELAEYYLRHGSPEFASRHAGRSVELDPDSPRCLEVCLESAILVRDRNEAERCYGRLRLLSDDRAKFQAYREKIDALAAS